VGQGRAGTRFPAADGASPAKRWLANADGQASGSVTVNAGAESALADRSRMASLLPVGIEQVEGHFSRGDDIQIRNEMGSVLGCGRAQYDHQDARKLIGQRGQKPMIHYDYLYLSET
jgi:glutamate 5-kinase